jgi:hypothetical protein
LLELSNLATFNPLTSKFEVDVFTGSPKQIDFFIRAELTDMLSIFIFTSQLTVEVICGSEVFTTATSEVWLPVRAPSSN